MFKPVSYLLIAAMITVTSACGPITKDDYMEDFAEFVEGVEDERESYSSADWQKVDAKYEHFSKNLYDRFEEDLTLKDRFNVGVYKLRYEGYRSGDTLLRGWKELVENEEVVRLREEVKRYLEEELEGDISALAAEAERIGKEIGTDLKQVIEELEDEQRDAR